MEMAAMNRIKGSAVEAKFQLWRPIDLLVETKYDVEQEDEDAKGDDAEGHW
ncbi:MAG: hypothetical protein RLZZ364_505 [Actinomycetota bacterium]|jgi:hypothetical protein